ncbi:MAG: 2-hydroxychromene-2-carboxylate isomerase [Candidatus Binataceae bacterium]
MSLQVDLFWSFRSPYSYLAVPRLVALEAEYDVEFRVRPVYPLAVRDSSFFQRVDPLFGPYLFRDTARIAEYMGLPFASPRPDPVVVDMQNQKAAAHQPYIHRLTRLGADASEKGCGLPFISEVSKLIWGGAVQGWDQGDHLAQAAARAGLDLATMDREIAAHPVAYESLIEQNHAALKAAGHWGVPTLVFEGEPFFGQDRIDLLVWRMKQRGLTTRNKIS